MLDGIEGIMTIAGAVNTVTGAIKGIGAATSGISAVLKVFSGIGLVIGGAITAVKNFINMFQNGFSVVKDILMGVGIALRHVANIRNHKVKTWRTDRLTL